MTVTGKEQNGSVSAFKAYEVKRESNPLDVAIVEQLCAKLIDMPSVTYRPIVSASGYTEAAIAKARVRGVSLLDFRPVDACTIKTSKISPISPKLYMTS